MPRKKRDRFYFTQKTEDSIVEYVKEKDQRKRNKIYEENIQYSFDKLAENIINTYKFQYFDVPFSDLKHEVVAFMIINIDKYDQSLGKAYSYFGTVAKNYLILHNNNNYKKMKIHDDLEVVDSVYNVEIDHVEQQSQEYTKEFIKLMIVYLDGKLPFIFKNKQDMTIADCVLDLFKNVNKIENFNKKALYLTLREMTGAKTQQITKVINSMKSYYLKARKEYKNKGDIQDNFFLYK